jgi:predicted regulator of Ras-like GTPase activity (Roadblock/LC7/MglB family)
MNTPFAEILRVAVEATPGAIGGAFAAHDGETVDAFARDDPEGWAIMTAHYGVLLAQVQSALHTFHYGEAEFMILSHERLDVLVHLVGDGYFALLAVRRPTALGIAMTQLARAAVRLRDEMG